jgi:hypothetical protein
VARGGQQAEPAGVYVYMQLCPLEHTKPDWHRAATGGGCVSFPTCHIQKRIRNNSMQKIEGL